MCVSSSWLNEPPSATILMVMNPAWMVPHHPGALAAPHGLSDGGEHGTEGWPLLQGWRSQRCCDLKTLCVLQTIRSPGHSLEPLRFDGSTIDDAPAERAIFQPAQRVADLLQHIRIVFGFGKCLRRGLVRDARVANVMRRVDEFSPAMVPFLANASGQSFVEVEEALLVVLNVHDVFPTTLRCSCDSPITARTLSSDHNSLW